MSSTMSSDPKNLPPAVTSSRIPGFYKYDIVDRAAMVSQWAGLSAQEQSVFFGLSGLTLNDADNMVENAIGLHSLPLGIATNFQVNGRDYLIPMVIEEPSVVACRFQFGAGDSARRRIHCT